MGSESFSQDPSQGPVLKTLGMYRVQVVQACRINPFCILLYCLWVFKQFTFFINMNSVAINILVHIFGEDLGAFILGGSSVVEIIGHRICIQFS